MADFHLFTPERQEKGQGHGGIKAGKGDPASKNCTEKMNAGSDLSYLFVQSILGIHIDAACCSHRAAFAI